MIPAPPGIYAEYLPSGNHDSYRAKQIVAFDDDGSPLVVNEKTGQLVAARYAERGFKGVGGVGKIVQVIPAPGWFGEYVHETSSGEKTIFRQPLVGWALYECGEVRPLAINGDFDIDNPVFADDMERIFHVDETSESTQQPKAADQ